MYCIYVELGKSVMKDVTNFPIQCPKTGTFFPIDCPKSGTNFRIEIL